MRSNTLLATALIAAGASGASVAQAGTILPDGFNIICQVHGGGTWQAINNPNDFNVTQTPNGAQISGASSGASWSAEWDSIEYSMNPFITTAWAFTNTTAQTQTFTVIFQTPINPLAGPTTMWGSITGGITDNDGSGATIWAEQGDSIYTAQVGGADVPGATLFDDPFSVSTVPPFQTASLGEDQFANMAGPAAAMTTIGIRHTFTLTAGDSVTFNSFFQIIPGPGGFALFGVAALFGRRRRR